MLKGSYKSETFNMDCKTFRGTSTQMHDTKYGDSHSKLFRACVRMMAHTGRGGLCYCMRGASSHSMCTAGAGMWALVSMVTSILRAGQPQVSVQLRDERRRRTLWEYWSKQGRDRESSGTSVKCKTHLSWLCHFCLTFLAPTGALEEGMCVCCVCVCPCDYAQNDSKRVPDAF